MTTKFLQPEERNIQEVFSGMYTIPVYQRPYSWEKEQVKQLLLDFNEAHNNYCVASKSDISNHNDEFAFFAGTIFIQNIETIKGQYAKYLVVDGQQRITTITMIMMVLLNRLREINSTDYVLGELEGFLWKKINRKNDKNYRILELGNIDKEIMNQLFNNLFSKDNIIEEARNKRYTNTNAVESNLLDNLLYINDFFSNYSEGELCDYYEYIKIHIRFITIEVFTDLPTMFNIFESINSKGKPLQDLDLIKSYIFQNIGKDDYEEYLDLWGKLILETNDNLMDYITVYVRANISYYVYGIKFSVFRSIAENKLQDYYKKTDLKGALKAFVKDLNNKVKFYKMLSDVIELQKNTSASKKIQTYFIMNELADYQHTRALYFKLLVMFDNGNIKDSVFEKIIETAFKFIVTFQSISSRESKNTIKTFALAQGNIYGKDTITSKNGNDIVRIFESTIKENGITTDSLRFAIKNTLSYESSKKVLKVILSYLESWDGKNDVNYDMLLSLLLSNKNLQLDHIMPLKPEKNDVNFYYYIDGDKVFLKAGHDFEEDKKAKIMIRDDFYSKYLHVIGNIRLKWTSENISKSNKVTLDDTGKEFNQNAQISKRTIRITNKILMSNILLNGDKFSEPEIKQSINTVVINTFNNDVNYKDYKPVSYEFMDTSLILDEFNYSNLLFRVVESFYDIEQTKILSLAKQNYNPMQSDRIYITTQEDELTRPYKIDDDIFVEANLSSNYIIKFIYLLIREIGLNESDIKITLKEK